MNLQHLRLTLSLTGMLLAVGAIAFDQPLLIWAAIGVLGLSLVVRIVIRRDASRAARTREDDRSID